MADVCVRLIILRILLISHFLGGTMYVGDPGDSLETYLYMDQFYSCPDRPVSHQKVFPK